MYTLDTITPALNKIMIASRDIAHTLHSSSIRLVKYTPMFVSRFCIRIWCSLPVEKKYPSITESNINMM